MWPAIGAIGASLIGGAFSAYGAKQQNRAAQRAAQAQMDFQREMRATRYQTTMADMKAAGLNPILAYQQGGGPVPSGSSYTPVNIGGAAATGLSQASGAIAAQATAATGRKEARTRAGKLSLEERIGEETVRNLNARTTREYADAHNSSALAQLHGRQLDKVHKEIEILSEDLQSAKALAARDRATEDLYKKSPWIRDVDIIGKALNPFSSWRGGLSGRSR